jgi:hypothetical protein
MRKSAVNAFMQHGFPGEALHLCQVQFPSVGRIPQITTEFQGKVGHPMPLPIKILKSDFVLADVPRHTAVRSAAG